VALLANLVLTIFLVLYGPRMLAAGFGQLRNDVTRRNVMRVAEAGYRRAWRYVVRSLGTAAVGGLAAFVVSSIANLPAPSALALVFALLSVVPYFGVVVGGLPMMLLAAAGSTSGAAALAVVAFVVGWQVVDGRVLQRWVHRGSIVFGPTLTVGVAMVGFELAGLIGVLCGLAYAVLLGSLADELATRAGVDDFHPDPHAPRPSGAAMEGSLGNDRPGEP
jgi:predicted PurR-regulated permease PerM